MKQVSFYRFCIGFLAAIFLGVIFACLQSNWPCWLTNLFAPVCGSPWEQSKLAFWPILGGIAIAKVSTKEQGGGELPMLVLTPIALSLALWLTQSHGSYFLLLWVVALAAGWALSGHSCKGRHVSVSYTHLMLQCVYILQFDFVAVFVRQGDEIGAKLLAHGSILLHKGKGSVSRLAAKSKPKI